MLARQQKSRKDPSLSEEVEEVNKAKAALKAKGWSYRLAAPELAVHYTHLARVLTGRRQSRRLLAAIHALPERGAN